MATATNKREIYLPELHAKQLEIVSDKSRFKVLSAGRRWGKTLLGCWLCMAYALQGKRAWWVAPTYTMALEGWRELRQMASEYGVVVKEAERTLITPNGGMVSVRSADNPDRLRGAGLDFIVLDECAFIKEQTWTEVLRPTLSDRMGSALFISTPKGYNWFQRLFEDAQSREGWATWTLPTSSNPLVPKSELDIAKEEVGSFLYSQEYEAQFIEATGGLIKPQYFKYYKDAVVTEFDKIGNYIDRRVLRFDDKQIYEDDTYKITTVDLAVSTKETADYTVICTATISKDNDIFVEDVIRDRIEAPDLIPVLQNIYDNYKPSFIGIEKTGYQLAMVQLARRSGLPIKELRADRDKVARAYPLSAKMEAGKIYFPRQKVWYANLERELLQFPAGEHDDQVDALAYIVTQVASRKEYRAY
jgi:predicted phage terminase large subunit-like protein|tara:strand:- start:14423 stop:15673 length:1251 start_codon:yes stop_codon:yes gene_type:complete